MKLFFSMIVAVAVLGIGGFFILNSSIYHKKQAFGGSSAQNAEYVIEGTRVRLVDGVSEEWALGSAQTSTVRYFGNDLAMDLDNDGRIDTVFLVTQTSGGSGTFYYVVAALNTESGYRGSEAYLLGDRIAPQSIEQSQNPRHKNVFVVNYADRKPGEAMSVAPSIGKSVYLKLNPQSMQFGYVEPNFEGESR